MSLSRRSFLKAVGLTSVAAVAAPTALVNALTSAPPAPTVTSAPAAVGLTTLSSVFVVTDEWLADSTYFEGLIHEQFARAWAYEWDDLVMHGNGLH